MSTIRAQISSDKGNFSLCLPCKDSELDRNLKAVGESDEITIKEVIMPEGLRMLNGLRVNADELNFLAKSIDRYDKDEFNQFLAEAQIIQNADVEQLINLSFNVSHYTLVQDVSNLARVGKRHLLNIGECVPTQDLDSFDFAKVGRELLASGKGIPTNYGLLFENDSVPFTAVYNGETFPQYCYRADIIAGVRLDYNGKSEYLYLPEESINIDKAVARLGNPTLEDCKVVVEFYESINDLWQSRMDDAFEYEGLRGANVLAGVLNDSRLDKDKLLDVVEYADVVGSDDIKKLAEHLDDFIVIKGAETLEEVAQHFLIQDKFYKAAPEVWDFINIEALGEHLMAERDGQFVGSAFVCMEDGCTFEEIMGDNSHNQNMEFGGM